MTQDARSLIMGTSSPAMSFNYPGDGVTGRIITEPKAVQQTVYDPRNPASKEPAFWPSGDPKMQVIFQIQTNFRNYEGIKNPDRTQPDNGARTIYLKGKHMERATAEAIRAVGADWLEIGGMVSYQYTGDDMTSMAGVKPKLFEVRYQPPAQQPPAHFNQSQPAQANGYHGQPAQPGYGAQQGYQPPAQPVQAVPTWQQPGWNTQQPVPGVPGGPGMHNSSPFPAPPVQAAPVPSHHGQPDQMPDWARAVSAPPAPSSAPPAPALSTLEAIRAAQTSGTPDYGSVQPAF